MSAEELAAAGFDDVVVSTGVAPRIPKMPGIDHEKVVSYQELLANELNLGQKVAIMGAGGIGFDVGEYLSHQGESLTLNKDAWMKEWGVDIRINIFQNTLKMFSAYLKFSKTSTQSIMPQLFPYL